MNNYIYIYTHIYRERERYYVIVTGYSKIKQTKKRTASLHRWTFSQALIAALKVTASGRRPRGPISSRRWSAHSHWRPFSQALMAELQVTTFGASWRSPISCGGGLQFIINKI